MLSMSKIYSIVCQWNRGSAKKPALSEYNYFLFGILPSLDLVIKHVCFPRLTSFMTSPLSAE